VEAADTAHVLNRVIAVLRGMGAAPAVLAHRRGRARVLMRLGAFAFALLTLEARRAPGAHAPHAVELHARFFHGVIWFWQRCAWMLWGCCIVLGGAAGLVPFIAMWRGWLIAHDRSQEVLWHLLYFVALPLGVAGVILGHRCGAYLRRTIRESLELYVVCNRAYATALQRWELLASTLSRLLIDEPGAARVRLFSDETVARYEYRRTVQAAGGERERTIATLGGYATRVCNLLESSGVAATCEQTPDAVSLRAVSPLIDASATMEWSRVPCLHRTDTGEKLDETPYQLSVMITATVRPLRRAQTIRDILAFGSALLSACAAVLVQLNLFRAIGIASQIMLVYTFGCAIGGYWLGARMGDVVEWYAGRRVAQNEIYKRCVHVLDEFVHHTDGLLHTRPFTLVF